MDGLDGRPTRAGRGVRAQSSLKPRHKNLAIVPPLKPAYSPSASLATRYTLRHDLWIDFRKEERSFSPNLHSLHSAIGYVTPADKLAGREEAIWSERKRKLAAAEARRQAAHAQKTAATQP
jgi:hypothetical protein